MKSWSHWVKEVSSPFELSGRTLHSFPLRMDLQISIILYMIEPPVAKYFYAYKVWALFFFFFFFGIKAPIRLSLQLPPAQKYPHRH